MLIGNNKMTTRELTQRDKKIIIKEIFPVFFNIIIAFVLGSIFIFALPFLVKDFIQLDEKSFDIIQIILFLIILIFLVIYFFVKTKNLSKDLSRGIKIVKKENLLDKKITLKKTSIIFLPENIRDNNLYVLFFESKVIKVNKDVFYKLEIGKEYELNYSPICNIIFNISDENNNYNC